MKGVSEMKVYEIVISWAITAFLLVWAGIGILLTCTKVASSKPWVQNLYLLFGLLCALSLLTITIVL